MKQNNNTINFFHFKNKSKRDTKYELYRKLTLTLTTVTNTNTKLQQ